MTNILNHTRAAALALVLAAAAAVAGAIGTAQAQDVMTPYSRFGYGILSDNATAGQRAMGSVGYAMQSGRQINVMNPASYAATDSLTFLWDIGMTANCLWSQEGDRREHDFGGGLDYMTMAFPVSKTVGASIGLLPYASVGYTFGGTTDNGAQSRSGTGGLNQLYAGVGWRPWGGLSVGFNAGYLFGTVTNESYLYPSTGSISLFQHKLEVRDWMVQLGAQYTLAVGARDRMTLGVTYSPGHDLHGHTWAFKEYYLSQSSTAVVDTIGHGALGGHYSLPATYGAGVSYVWHDRLTAELDFTYQPWADAKFQTQDGWDPTTFDNRWRLAAGLQWQPALRGAYGRRIMYRLGGFYTHDYLCVRGNNVREYGLTAGVGLPVNGFKTLINVSLEYRHRQATPDPLVKEQYLNICIGVNFNEMWFWRNKLR